MKKILFVDNDPDFLSTRAEFLERAGFQVLKAASLIDAETYLRNEWIVLAIFDIRMTNDDDEKDVSGMTLVTADYTQLITKIVLTSFNTPLVRDLVRIAQQMQSLVLDVIEKSDGPDILVAAVNDAFMHHIRINWSLAVDWRIRDSLSLTKLIVPELEGEYLLSRADEFEDIFRRLFYEKDHIRIEHLLWRRDGRVALGVFAFKEGLKPESFVVICGSNVIVNNEAECFDQYAPKMPGGNSTTLGENTRAETTHFSANAYSLTSNDLETIQSLLDLYRIGTEKTFNTALNNLFQETLKAWHQDKFIRSRGNSRIVSYAERFRLGDVDLRQIDERVRVIEALLPTLEVKTTRTTDSFSVKFKNQSFDHSNPVPILSELVKVEEQEVFVTVPGFLSGDNILTDSTGKTWLTDFADAGLAPVLWNCTSIEALIRYDWVDIKDLQRRYELEHCLIQTDFFKPEIRDLEPSLRKPARAIQLIRKLAARTVGKDTLFYHQGMFFHAANRLMGFDPGRHLTNIELARYGHILLSMAMLADILKESNPDSNGSVFEQEEQILIFDEGARILLVGNRKERLPRQPFALFKYLYEKPNQLCTKDELLREVLQNKYDEGYLHTLIGRIRKAIEVDPEHPRFLFTLQNAGYKLIPKPE